MKILELVNKLIRVHRFRRRNGFGGLVTAKGFFWHWLHAYFVVKLPPLQFHVDCALVAYRTSVRDVHQVLVAASMHVMPAQQTDDCRGRREEIVETEWTVAVRCSLDTRVGIRCGDGDADIASLAVDIVFSNALTSTTNPTVVAVIDAFCAIIVPKLALVTVVVCRLLKTLDASFARWLRSLTKHAEHTLRFLSVQSVWKGRSGEAS